MYDLSKKLMSIATIGPCSHFINSTILRLTGPCLHLMNSTTLRPQDVSGNSAGLLNQSTEATGLWVCANVYILKREHPLCHCAGEHWDQSEEMDTYYNPVPHFTYQMALDHSPTLQNVRFSSEITSQSLSPAVSQLIRLADREWA